MGKTQKGQGRLRAVFRTGSGSLGLLPLWPSPFILKQSLPSAAWPAGWWKSSVIRGEV